MMKLFQLKYYSLKQSGLLFALAFFVLAYTALSFGLALGFEATGENRTAGIGRALYEKNLDTIKMVTSSTVIGITFLLFVFPLLKMKGNKDMGSLRYMELSMSLPVTRKKFALSQGLFLVSISLLLIALFSAAAWIGLMKGAVGKEAGEVFLKVLILLLTVEINLAGAAATAICLGTKRPGLVAALFLGLLYIGLLKAPSGFIYDFVTTGSFWTVLAAATLLVNLICGLIAVGVFQRKDI